MHLIKIIKFAFTFSYIAAYSFKPNEEVDCEQTLDRLYELALKEYQEKGPLVVLEGGDGKKQRNFVTSAYTERFGLPINSTVNFSNRHDIEIDAQLQTGSIDFDVARLQTIHDFYKWKEQGHLLQYKPIGFEHVFEDIKDPDGYFVATEVIAFAPIIQNTLYGNVDFPVEDLDFFDQKLKDKLVLTYPNSDDAVLYQFYRLTQKYGKEYTAKIYAMNPKWILGTAASRNMVSNKTYLATFTAGSTLVTSPSDSARMILPKKSEFLTWGQTAAIFKKAKHPNQAKLFLSWSLSEQYQTKVWTRFPSRTDFLPPQGFKHAWEYPNTSPKKFIKFMLNRDLVNSFSRKVEEVIGKPAGPNPFDDPNL